MTSGHTPVHKHTHTHIQRHTHTDTIYIYIYIVGEMCSIYNKNDIKNTIYLSNVTFANIMVTPVSFVSYIFKMFYKEVHPSLSLSLCV